MRRRGTLQSLAEWALVTLLTVACAGPQPLPTSTVTDASATGSADTGGSDTGSAPITPVAGPCQVTPGSFTFLYDATSKPAPVQCFLVRNGGSKAMGFVGATIDPANPQYTFGAMPSPGDALPGKGSPDNPDGSVAWQVCLAYHPDSVAGNEKARLVVRTDGEPVECGADLDAQPDGTLGVGIHCGKTGKSAFFDLPQPVTSTSTCQVCNDGSAVLKLQNALVLAYDAGSQAAANASFDIHFKDLAGSPQVLYAMAPGKCVDLDLEFTPQGGKPAPNAYVAFDASAKGIHGAVALPIVAAPCAGPQLELGPAEVLAQAAVGGTWQGTVALANQGCAPLTVTAVCLGAASPDPAAPCGKPPAMFTVSPPLANPTLPPTGLATVQVAFAPTLLNPQPYQGALVVQYCPGSFSGGKCSVPLALRVLPLAGRVTTSVAPAVPKPSIQVASGALAVGSSVHLQLVAAVDVVATRWSVTGRPAGSRSWIPAELQSGTVFDMGTLVPDLPGTYQLAAQVLVDVLGIVTVSEQVSASVVVP